MIEINVDFDEIREYVIDNVFALAGVVAGFVESVIDVAEDAFTRPE